jgi:hypothetical protein
MSILRELKRAGTGLDMLRPPESLPASRMNIGMGHAAAAVLPWAAADLAAATTWPAGRPDPGACTVALVLVAAIAGGLPTLCPPEPLLLNPFTGCIRGE